MIITLELTTVIILSLIALISGLILGVTVTRPRTKTDKETAQDLEKAELRIKEQPEKIKPAWDLARLTLEAYFNRNLNQVNSIYILSIGVMIIGFLLIILSFTLIIFREEPLQNADLIFAIGSTAGVITEMIGATFLFIYRSTIQQAQYYTATLERINSVGMAMQILDTMPERAKNESLKNQTKAHVVESIVLRNYLQKPTDVNAELN